MCGFGFGFGGFVGWRGGGEVGRWCLCVLVFSYFLSTTPEKTEIEYYISN